MNKDNFIIQTKTEPKRTDERFEILLKLSELRKKQIQKSKLITIQRKDLIQSKEELKQITEKLNSTLDKLDKWT